MSVTPKTETLNVMFVDIVDYTKTTLSLDIHKFDALHSVFDDIVTRVSQKFKGTIIKKIGDAFLLTFQTPLDAINCGLGLQQAQLEHNRTSDLVFVCAVFALKAA